MDPVTSTQPPETRAWQGPDCAPPSPDVVPPSPDVVPPSPSPPRAARVELLHAAPPLPIFAAAAAAAATTTVDWPPLGARASAGHRAALRAWAPRAAYERPEVVPALRAVRRVFHPFVTAALRNGWHLVDAATRAADDEDEIGRGYVDLCVGEHLVRLLAAPDQAHGAVSHSGEHVATFCGRHGACVRAVDRADGDAHDCRLRLPHDTGAPPAFEYRVHAARFSRCDGKLSCAPCPAAGTGDVAAALVLWDAGSTGAPRVVQLRSCDAVIDHDWLERSAQPRVRAALGALRDEDLIVVVGDGGVCVCTDGGVVSALARFPPDAPLWAARGAWVAPDGSRVFVLGETHHDERLVRCRERAAVLVEYALSLA